MKKYWFIIETYVFLWKKESSVLVYNTLSGHGYTYNCTPLMSSFIDKLISPENLYCISIDEEFLNEPSILEFVNSMQTKFCGTLFDREIFPQKPIVVVPRVNISEDVERTESSDIFGDNVLRNLTDIFIELTGQCNNSCPDCESIYKQTCWCHKSESTLSFRQLETIFDKIKFLNVFELHLLGGNMFAHPDWNKLLSKFNEIPCKKSFYVHYTSFLNTNECISKLLQVTNSVIKILIDFANINREKHDLDLLSIWDKRFEYIFLIRSTEEYEKACNRIENGNLNAKIIPFFNSHNLSFFQENIYLNVEDILSTSWSKNEKFANQQLNTNDFGKIRIATNGYIYANPNYQPIGKWDDDYKKLIYNELRHGNSWRRTRDKQAICKECIYKYLCPSPSNYEIAIQKPNLCNL